VLLFRGAGPGSVAPRSTSRFQPPPPAKCVETTGINETRWNIRGCRASPFCFAFFFFSCVGAYSAVIYSKLSTARTAQKKKKKHICKQTQTHTHNRTHFLHTHTHTHTHNRPSNSLSCHDHPLTSTHTQTAAVYPICNTWLGHRNSSDQRERDGASHRERGCWGLRRPDGGAAGGLKRRLARSGWL